MTLRLFAALTLPDEVVDALEAAQAGLPGRLVDPENFHITLAFFGELGLAEAEDLAEGLDALEAPGFEAMIEGVSVFGGDAPRIAYARVAPDPALMRLRDRVRSAALGARVALRAERYTPHVTLARKPIAPDERLRRWLEREGALALGPIEAASFTLFRSDLTPTGPIYEPVAEFPLSAWPAAAG